MTFSPAFQKAVALVLKHEGGYVNDPNDPGGETRYGISKRAYPKEDIAALTLDRARELYHRDYWTPIQGDALPFPLALVVFDMAVNAGVGAAVRQLQETVAVPVDGVLGPQTLGKARATDPVDAATRATRRRILYYSSLPGWKHYAKSWTQRTLETLLVAAT